MRPEIPPLRPRTAEIVQVARNLLEELGWEALTMRLLAERVGMRAPSLYNHAANKDELRTFILTESFLAMGDACWQAVATERSPASLARAYREQARTFPHHYRLATSGPLDREALPEGLEEWAGTPFRLVTDSPTTAQALFASFHGLAILEVDGRFPEGTDIDRLWERTAELYSA
ncbi:TetR family transcriptional regulator [Corynebacterium humireducens NBRC 106098 = DSM 45392]|uniref:TetR family transcriptional regulator n=1 Tax=Corynebacterium humireducens NBRC 106098 = DSM 45392 TaxID=1223515 RepID=A0A0B5DBW4_9CORY|nr:TetR/AcrR family transcriptional regulator [Corynebacterium humireducens]AJE33648.1 TetR family transcriptional regulator [Corynebacterium humireducens NBRC 106098 = DSM 45392]